MARSKRIVVIGAGVAGLSTAYHAARLEFGDVLVLEKRHPAAGSSGASVGDVSTLYETESDIRIRALSMDFFETIGDEVGFHEIGALRTVDDPAGEARIATAAAIHADWGFPAKVVDPEGMRNLIPDLATGDLLAGIYSPRAGHVDGHLLCDAYRRRAEALGARVLPGTEVYGATDAPGRGLRLDTSIGSIDCDIVVNAAGAWAGELGDRLHAPARVLPQRHQVCLGELIEPLPYVMLQFLDSFGYTDSGDGLYFRYESPTQLIMGIHRSYQEEAETADPDRFDQTVDTDYVDRVADAIHRRLPRLIDTISLQKGWAGLYPLTANGRPQVGPHPSDERVVAAYGLGGAGIQISPVIGQLAAEWIGLTEPTVIPDPHAFLPPATSLTP